MTDFFENMDSTLRIYWYIAIGTSIIFIIQTILSFVGSNADSIDIDLEDSSDSFQIFSFRNLINFLLGFSWSGIAFFNTLNNKAILISISVLIGLVFIFIFFLILKVMMKLAENNSFDINNTINKTADVYLTIPSNKSGKGKVLISVKGSIHELSAITLNNKEIKSGQIVKVLSIVENQILVVDTI